MDSKSNSEPDIAKTRLDRKGVSTPYSDKRNGNWDQSITEIIKVDHLHCPCPVSMVSLQADKRPRLFILHHPLDAVVGGLCTLDLQSTGAAAADWVNDEDRVRTTET